MASVVAKQKIYKADSSTIDDAKGIVQFVASTSSEDRDEEVVAPSAWSKRLASFMKHPVLLSSHDYSSLRRQIGHILSIDANAEGKLVATAQYYINEGNDEADWGFKLAQRGMAAYSVGFLPHDWITGKKSSEPKVTYTDVELLEVSQVVIPSNRDSLQLLASKSAHPIVKQLATDLLERLQAMPTTKGAIPPAKAPKASEDTPWNAAAEVAKAEGVRQLKRMHAWMDPDGDPDAKSTYKLPHHTASGDVVWNGVKAAGGVMQGARGGVDIPDADVTGVRDHLALHYRQFDKVPPWEEQAKGLDKPVIPHDEEDNMGDTNLDGKPAKKEISSDSEETVASGAHVMSLSHDHEHDGMDGDHTHGHVHAKGEPDHDMPPHDHNGMVHTYAFSHMHTHKDGMKHDHSHVHESSKGHEEACHGGMEEAVGKGQRHNLIVWCNHTGGVGDTCTEAATIQKGLQASTGSTWDGVRKSLESGEEIPADILVHLSISAIQQKAVTVKAGKRNSAADLDEMHAIHEGVMQCMERLRALMGDEKTEMGNGKPQPVEETYAYGKAMKPAKVKDEDDGLIAQACDLANKLVDVLSQIAEADAKEDAGEEAEGEEVTKGGGERLTAKDIVSALDIDAIKRGAIDSVLSRLTAGSGR